MKILLDECVDRRLAREIEGHDVTTTQQQGWSGIDNGKLLNLTIVRGDSAIGDGDSSRVPREILDDLLGSREGSTDIDVPVLLSRRRAREGVGTPSAAVPHGIDERHSSAEDPFQSGNDLALRDTP